MINLDSRAFEKLITEFIDARDIRTLVDKFSRDRVFYYYVLKDISRGKESLNYSILKKVARKKKVSESFIVEQAKSVLSYIAPYDEPEIENYYEILNVSPDASEETIRERWIELMKSHHPDKAGEKGLDQAKRINEAYEVLSSPTKRIDYDTKHPPDIPIQVKEHRVEGVTRVLLYLIPFLLVIGASYFYLSSSGLFLQNQQDRENLILSIENPTLPSLGVDGDRLNADIKKEDDTSFINESEGSEEILITDKNDENIISNKIFRENMEVKQDGKDLPEQSPEFVKIIDEEDNSSDMMPHERSSFGSDFATPAVAVDKPEMRISSLPPNMPAPDSNSLFDFVLQYVSAYKNRDLQTIRSLFAPNATENGVSIYKVLDTYKNNFSTLDILRYDVKVKRSTIDNYAGIIMGDFIVTFLDPTNKTTKNSRGSITWLLRWRGHKWEIEEINYKIHDTSVIDGR